MDVVRRVVSVWCDDGGERVYGPVRYQTTNYPNMKTKQRQKTTYDRHTPPNQTKHTYTSGKKDESKEKRPSMHTYLPQPPRLRLRALEGRRLLLPRCTELPVFVFVCFQSIKWEWVVKRKSFSWLASP